MREWEFEQRLCAHLETVSGIGGLTGCSHFDRLVDPATDCGPSCPGFEPADPPAHDRAAHRDRHSPWVANPTGAARRQVALDRFLVPAPD